MKIPFRFRRGIGACPAVLLFCFGWSAAATDLYVSPKGDDDADGSKKHPFATLSAARDAVRKLPKDQDVTIWLGGGDYYFDSPFRLGPEDSGVAAHTVTYRAIKGETPRLLGGRRLNAENFHPVADPATLARIARDARGKIVELDLAKASVRNAGPYPAVFRDSGSIAGLFHDGRRLPLARYPKKGYMTFAKVIDNAGGLSDWRNPASVMKVDPNGPGGTFQYRDGDAAKFEVWNGQLDRGVWLRGYWRVTWEVSGQRLLTIDTAAHTATFARPIPGGIGNKYTRPAGNGRESYWVLNLLEEVTEPGEWCLDFKDRKIYLYPPSFPPGNDGILLMDETAPVIELRDASRIILRGLTIEANLGDGIRITGGEGNLVAGCTVRNVDKYAVVVDGGKNHTVLSNDLYHLGAGGVWLGGGDEAASPRIPAGTG